MVVFMKYQLFIMNKAISLIFILFIYKADKASQDNEDGETI